MLRTQPRWARAAFAAVMLAGIAVLLQQWAAGGTPAGLPGELQMDRLAVLGKLVLMGCGLALALGFHGPGAKEGGGHKFWLLLLLLLLGVSLAYGGTGSLAILDFSRSLAGGSGQSRAAGLLVLCGLFVKAAVFPFHGWAPDAYAGTRIQVTATLLACTAFDALCPVHPGCAGTPADDDIAALHGKFTSQPVAALLLTLAVLSLAGLRPFPGFFAKLFGFRSVIASGHLWAATAAFAGSFQCLAYYPGLLPWPTTCASCCTGSLPARSRSGLARIPTPHPLHDGRVVGVLSIGDLVGALVQLQAEAIQSLRAFIGSDDPT